MEGNISNFLDRYRKITPPDETVRRAVCEAIKRNAGIPVKKNDVTVKKGIAYVSAGPAAKNRILIKKEFLIRDLTRLLGDKAPKDIR